MSAGPGGYDRLASDPHLLFLPSARGKGRRRPGDRGRAKWGCARVGGGEAELEQAGRLEERKRETGPRSAQGARRKGRAGGTQYWHALPVGATRLSPTMGAAETRRARYRVSCSGLWAARGYQGLYRAPGGCLWGSRRYTTLSPPHSNRVETPLQGPGAHRLLKPFRSWGTFGPGTVDGESLVRAGVRPSRAPCWPASAPLGARAPRRRPGLRSGKPYRGNLEA